MSSAYRDDDRSYASSGRRDNDNSEDKSSSETTNYSLNSLREFMSRKRLFTKTQFIIDDTVAFIKVHIESIGESILVYFPSAFVVPREEGSVPIVEIVPYELSEEDKALIASADDSEDKESYSELNIDDLKDKDSFSSESYKPIAIDNNKEQQVRKQIAGYQNQLDKFRRATAHIKYKFAIMTNNVLSVISRRNEVESYILRSGGPMIKPIVDNKNDTVIQIPHELLIVIDLPSFFEKIEQVTTDVLTVYKNFYSMLNRAHTKQTALAEHRFKNYNVLIGRLMSDYAKNAKYLDMIASLTSSLEKTVEQEQSLIQKIKIVNDSQGVGMSADTTKSFKLNKGEQDLARIRDLKSKTTNLLQDIKTRYNSFIISFDHTISVVCKNLRGMESQISALGISMDRRR
jgi:hypothetical protein